MRVGIVSLYHESNTFAKKPTTLEDFERHILLQGREFGSRFDWKHHEVSGFFDTVKVAGFEAVPIAMASALPGGTIDRPTIESLLRRIFEEVERSGPLDGYLVAPHGAAVAEGLGDVDGFWLSRLRKFAGEKVPILGTLDPHANLSPDMVHSCNALIAYKTNPHVDQYARGSEAAGLMVRTLRGEIHPVMAAAYPPITINIERQNTSQEPCVSLYAFGSSLAARTGVLATTLVLGFPYADVPEMGTGFAVVTDGDMAAAQKFADEWSTELWRTRSRFVAELLDIDQAIDLALNSAEPVCMLDMGDNIGGGSPGDSTFLLQALHRRQMGNSFICLFDPSAAEEAWSAGPEASLTLSMGAHSDCHHGTPLEVPVKVISLHEGRFVETKPRHGAMANFDMGKTAIVGTTTGITIMLTSRRTFPTSLVQLTSCGLDPGRFRIMVAKGVHAPVAAYNEVCRSFIRVNTPGLTTADLSALNYRRRRQPMYPFEAM